MPSAPLAGRKKTPRNLRRPHLHHNPALERLDLKVPQDPAVRTDRSHQANAAAGVRVDQKAKAAGREGQEGQEGPADLGETSADHARI